MSFTVENLLSTDMMKNIVLLGGENKLNNEIKGITIIEAPDIAKFIDGGEVLLTSLYAFRTCNIDEYKNYLNQLLQKNISALLFKSGRHELSKERISLIINLSNKYEVPLIEIPAEVHFCEIIYMIMEKLFDSEVSRLKYFKETCDNFMLLSLKMPLFENSFERILMVLENLIGNSVALFDKNLLCMATTDDSIKELNFIEKFIPHNLSIYSHYTYFKKDNEYLIEINITLNAKMYLVIKEVKRPINTMDYIAIENAITALLLEFNKQATIMEIEKKFKGDIINEIFKGTISSKTKLIESSNILGLSIEGTYRVLVFTIEDKKIKTSISDVSTHIEYNNILYEGIVSKFYNVNIQNNISNIVVLCEGDNALNPNEIKEKINLIQKKVQSKNENFIINVGIGSSVEGLLNVSKSFKEANEALLLSKTLEESNGENANITFFSDLGIVRLLCKFDNPLELEEFIPETLKKLNNSKKAQKSDLLMTLKIYLKNNQNIAKTARDMFLHYKTVQYRIDKIVSITSIDFSNLNDVLALQIGFIILKAIEQYNNKHM